MIGSRSVIQRQYATAHPAADPRPGPDPDAGVAGVLDEVPGDQEVRREAHVVDDLELVGDPLDDAVRQVVAPPPLGALPGQVLEVLGVAREPLGQREVRQQGVTELDLEVGALGDPEAVVARLRQFAEQVAHLLRRLQVVLVALELESLRVGDQRAGLDAQQGVVRLVIFAVGVVTVVGGEQRRADLLGDLDELGVGLVLGGDAVVLQLDEQVVPAEDVLQPGGLLERALVVAVEHRLEHLATEASGGGDQPVGVLLDQLPVDPGLVVVALEERQAATAG